MRLFFIAFQFLTIIPLPFQVRCEEKDLGRSMALFPLVGLTLGGLLVAADYLLAQLFPRQVGDLLLIALLALLTGALHLDGLADVCDGLAARGGKERFLAIMKDSRVGAVGAVGLLFAILLKYQALLHVGSTVKIPALLLFPVLARFGQVLMVTGARSARENGLGISFITGTGTAQLLTALITVLAIAFMALAWFGVALVAVTAAVALAMRRYFHKRLDGITGDIIGCASELTEITALLLIVAWCDRI